MTTRDVSSQAAMRLSMFQLGIQLLVTVILLGFAYIMRGTDKTLSNIVVTAATLHWLQQAREAGREASKQIEYARDKERANGIAEGDRHNGG